VSVSDGFALDGPAAEVILAVIAWAAKMERLAIAEHIRAAREPGCRGQAMGSALWPTAADSTSTTGGLRDSERSRRMSMVAITGAWRVFPAEHRESRHRTGAQRTLAPPSGD
jgi:hypothetical protein